MRVVLAVAFLLLILVSVPENAMGQESPPTVTPFPFTMPPPSSHGLIMPDLGPDASQADYGAEVYRLVCKACHGDRGQGLTPDWIAQWAPEDQNCWQLKCHAANHPPEGFVLPRDVPPVVGQMVVSRFPTALALHNYIAASMPWHAPGTLEASEYWQATVQVLRMNGVDVGGITLDESNAASFRLQPPVTESAQMSAAAAPNPTHPPGAAATRQAQIAENRALATASREGWPWGWAVLLLASTLGALWVIYTAARQL